MPITLGHNPFGGLSETGISSEEVNRIKHAGSMNEALQRNLWEKIKDWINGTASKGRAVRERLYTMLQGDYPPSARVQAFYELRGMVEPEHRDRFHLLFDRGDPHDPQALVRVMMEIEGLCYGECSTSGEEGLPCVDIPREGLMVRYDGFSSECLLGSRLFAAGLVFTPHCEPPPEVTYLDVTGRKVVRPPDWDGKNVEVTWHVEGNKLQHEGAGAKTATGLSSDFYKDFDRGDFEFVNEQNGKSGNYHYGVGSLLGDEPGDGEGIESSGGNAVERTLEEIEGIFPARVFACLTEVCHQGYFADLMKYIYEHYLGGLGEIPPLMLNQERDRGGGEPPPAYLVTLGSDGNCCIEAACTFDFLDPKNVTILQDGKLKAKRVTVISQKDLLSGNFDGSRCEYHFKLQDRTENLFCFAPRPPMT